ncbi:MAG: 1,4-beta-xylanase, partial [Pedobacter sp.]
MKNIRLFLLFVLVSILVNSCIAQKTEFSKTATLKETYHDYFSIGVAVGPKNLVGDEAVLIKKQFNSITAENAMKMESLQP